VEPTSSVFPPSCFVARCRPGVRRRREQPRVMGPVVAPPVNGGPGLNSHSRRATARWSAAPYSASSSSWPCAEHRLLGERRPLERVPTVTRAVSSPRTTPLSRASSANAAAGATHVSARHTASTVPQTAAHLARHVHLIRRFELRSLLSSGAVNSRGDPACVSCRRRGAR
jgi:hypothetical protein